MNEIRKYPLLTFNEERKLLEIAQKYKNQPNNTSRKKAIDKLVCSNQLFVVSIAKKYATNDNIFDLVNEGNLGLIKAIDKFDLKKDYKFITYAVWWIRKSIVDYITEKSNIVKPASANKIYHYVNAAKKEFINKNERQPQLNELRDLINEKFGFYIENLNDLETIQTVSIDESCCNDDDVTVGNSYEYNMVTSSNNIDEKVDKDDKIRIVSALLSTLNKRERLIISKLYGIGCVETSMESIGDELGITKERVRQIVNQCLNKLKKIYNNRNFNT